jgi:hypothetical protein
MACREETYNAKGHVHIGRIANGTATARLHRQRHLEDRDQIDGFDPATNPLSR